MSLMAAAFYVREDIDVYAATEHTRGPWDPDAQHAGPPAALLGYALDRAPGRSREHSPAAHEPGARPGMRIARIMFDILRPVPITSLRVSTAEVHTGRSVEVVSAELSIAATGRVVMRASALRIRAQEGAAPAHLPPATVPPPDELDSTTIPMRFDVGYHTAMETRNAAGTFQVPGPATVWFRMRHPLIDGEPIDALSRVLIAADSGNGVSGVLSLREYVFVNPELTVHLYRYPDGEWVCLDAVTHIDPAGIGLADTMLHDESGPIGRGSQSLYVARSRSAA
jgi:hypothetical protein